MGTIPYSLRVRDKLEQPSYHQSGKRNRKQDIKTRNIKKWKVLLKIDGSRIKKSIHYKQTYALVDYWNSIQLVLKLSLVHKWKILQLDYVLEFSQAPVQIDFTTTSSNLR